MKYVYTEVPLTPDEARARKAFEIESIEGVIESMEYQLEMERDRLASPLETTRTVQEKIGPEDPRYADAPVNFDPLKYQGTFTWSNTPSDSDAQVNPAWVNGTPTDMRIAELEEVPEGTQRTGGREFRKYL